MQIFASSRERTHHLNVIPDILVSKQQTLDGVFPPLASDIPGVILPPSGHTRSLPSLAQMRKPLSSKALQIESLNCKG